MKGQAGRACGGGGSPLPLRLNWRQRPALRTHLTVGGCTFSVRALTLAAAAAGPGGRGSELMPVHVAALHGPMHDWSEGTSACTPQRSRRTCGGSSLGTLPRLLKQRLLLLQREPAGGRAAQQSEGVAVGVRCREQRCAMGSRTNLLAAWPALLRRRACWPHGHHSSRAAARRTRQSSAQSAGPAPA